MTSIPSSLPESAVAGRMATEGFGLLLLLLLLINGSLPFLNTDFRGVDHRNRRRHRRYCHVPRRRRIHAPISDELH
jgi:hypothetical protein